MPGILPTANIDDKNIVTASGEAKNYILGAATNYLFVPQTLSSGTKIAVALKNGNKYEATLADDLVLAQGTSNTITLTLSPTDTSISVSVKEWVTGANAEGTALNVSVSSSDGTFSGISSLSVWKDGSTAKSDYTYDSSTGWGSSSPYFVEDCTSSDLFFVRHTPAEDTADGTTGVLDILGNRTGVSISNGGLSVTLEHLMTRLSVALTRGTGLNENVDLTGATITLPGILSEVELDDKNVSVAKGIAKSYTLSANVGYLFAPQTIAAGTEIKVTLSNGNSYVAKLADAIDMKQGTASKLTLVLNPSEVRVNVGTIDWVDGENYNQIIGLNGITKSDEGGSDIAYTAVKDDKLSIQVTDGITTLNTEYVFNGSRWITDSPLYWNEFDSSKQLTVYALLTPATLTPMMPDYLTGTAVMSFGHDVSLVLNHVMTKVGYVIKAGEGYTSDDVKTAVLTIPVGAWSDIDEVPTATAAMICVPASYAITLDHDAETEKTSSDGIIAPVIVCPHTYVAGDVMAEVKINGNIYTVKAPSAGMKFEAGKCHTVTVTITKMGIGIGMEVNDWEDGGNTNLPGEL